MLLTYSFVIVYIASLYLTSLYNIIVTEHCNLSRIGIRYKGLKPLKAHLHTSTEERGSL